MAKIDDNDRLYEVRNDHTLIYGRGCISVENSTNIVDIKKAYRPLRLRNSKNVDEWTRGVFGVHGY